MPKFAHVEPWVPPRVTLVHVEPWTMPPRGKSVHVEFWTTPPHGRSAHVEANSKSVSDPFPPTHSCLSPMLAISFFNPFHRYVPLIYRTDIAISDKYCGIGTKIRRPNFWTVRISTQMDDLFSSRNRIYYIRVCAILRLRNIYYSLSSLSSSCSSPLSAYSKTLSAADCQSN